jgi:hypothetical protein
MISKAFVWWLIIATIVLLGGFYGVSLVTHIPVVLYIATVAFAVMTFLLYKNILQANEKSPRRFVTAFMASITVKLLVTASFLGIYIYFNKDQKVPVALGMMVVYVVNLIVLVRNLTSKVSS